MVAVYSSGLAHASSLIDAWAPEPLLRAGMVPPYKPEFKGVVETERRDGEPALARSVELMSASKNSGIPPCEVEILTTPWAAEPAQRDRRKSR